MRKVELLPTRDCEAGYGPDYFISQRSNNNDFIFSLDGPMPALPHYMNQKW